MLKLSYWLLEDHILQLKIIMAMPYRLVDSSSRVVHTNDDMELESFIGLSMPLRKLTALEKESLKNE